MGLDARILQLEALWQDWEPGDGPRPSLADLHWIRECVRAAVEQGLPCPQLYFRSNAGVSAEWGGGPAVGFPSMDIVRSPTGVRFLSSWWEQSEGGRHRRWYQESLPVEVAPAQLQACIVGAIRRAHLSWGQNEDET